MQLSNLEIFFKLRIVHSDKDKNFKKAFITYERDEYIIKGIWYKKLNAPLFSYTLFIVSSLKKKPLMVKNKEKAIKNKDIFIEIKL